ncbi:hypothetical protein H0H92_012232 [Tricholoma furcatifolium]|nr:hypothetical protein H0H92_012232 [Tricholoma furcatifolium]
MGVPYNLRDAARIALKINLVVKSRHPRTDTYAFQPLVDDACGLVYILLYTDLGHAHFEGITRLCEILEGILTYLKAHGFRNTLSRAFKAKEIQRQVQDFRGRLRSSTALACHFIDKVRQHRMSESAPQENGQPSATHASVPIPPVTPPASHTSHEPERPRPRVQYPTTPTVMPPGYISIVVNVDSGITRDSGNMTTTTTSESYNDISRRVDESRFPEGRVHNYAVVDH